MDNMPCPNRADCEAQRDFAIWGPAALARRISINAGDLLDASVSVTNAGKVAGDEKRSRTTNQERNKVKQVGTILIVLFASFCCAQGSGAIFTRLQPMCGERNTPKSIVQEECKFA